MSRGLVIELTKSQIKKLTPLRRKVMLAAGQNKCGILLAQIYDDHMDVGFVKHEKAIKIVLIAGGDPTKTINSAYEKPLRKGKDYDKDKD